MTQLLEKAFSEASRLPQPDQDSVAQWLFAANPLHPSLRFKRVHPTRPVDSARVTRDYWAVGALDGDDILWFGIGPHDEYERLLASL